MGEAILASLAEEAAGPVFGYEFVGLVNGRIWKRKENIRVMKYVNGCNDIKQLLS